MAHIFCTIDSGIPIKSYTPEIIVHPSLKDSNTNPIDKMLVYYLILLSSFFIIYLSENMEHFTDEIVETISKWY